MGASRWTRYAALGDSITEGWCDPVLGDGEPWFGWADRLALVLDAESRKAGGPRLEFANLAVRGRRIRHVVEDQIPAAIAMRADLVSVFIGGNDLMALRADPDTLAARLGEGIAQLRSTGADVLLATGFDPGRSQMLRVLRHRTAVFNANLISIARDHDCMLLDVWGLREFRWPFAWAEDRVHPSTLGHLALAREATRALGVPPPGDPHDELTLPRRISTIDWLVRHGLPWIGRKVRRVSSGDGRVPKIPAPMPVAELAPHLGEVS